MPGRAGSHAIPQIQEGRIVTRSPRLPERGPQRGVPRDRTGEIGCPALGATIDGVDVEIVDRGHDKRSPTRPARLRLAPQSSATRRSSAMRPRPAPAILPPDVAAAP